MSAIKDHYVRAAKLIRVLDGDTIEVDIDLGFYLTVRQTVRFAYINAPEVHGVEAENGLSSKAALITKLGDNPALTLSTVKPHDKYGRYLAMVFMGDEYINNWMVEAGWATYGPGLHV